jgi:hypothetical protein
MMIMRKLRDWINRAICLMALVLLLGISGCAWIKAGEPFSKDQTVKDEQEAADIVVDTPFGSESQRLP